MRPAGNLADGGRDARGPGEMAAPVQKGNRRGKETPGLGKAPRHTHLARRGPVEDQDRRGHREGRRRQGARRRGGQGRRRPQGRERRMMEGGMDKRRPMVVGVARSGDHDTNGWILNQTVMDVRAPHYYDISPSLSAVLSSLIVRNFTSGNRKATYRIGTILLKHTIFFTQISFLSIPSVSES